MSVNGVGHGVKRPRDGEGETSAAKKAKPNLSAVEVWKKSIAFLGDVRELFAQCRTSKRFRRAVIDYYGSFPKVGSAEQIKKSLVPWIQTTQRTQERPCKVEESDIDKLCQFAAFHLRKLPPHQWMVMRAGEECPRTLRILGGKCYAIFNRYKAKGDRSLTDGERAAFKRGGLCYQLGEGLACSYMTIKCKGEENCAAAKQEEETAKRLHGARNVAAAFHTFRFKSKKEDKPEKLGLIGPFCNGGTLEFCIDDKFLQSYPLLLIVKLAHDVALGLSEIHARGLVHRDLKTANIMLHQPPDNVLTAKIIDFGATRTASNKQEGTYDSTTEDSYAPEVCAAYLAEHGLAPCGYPTDMWGVGCVLYEMTMGKPPPFVLPANEIQKQLEDIADMEIVYLPEPHPQKTPLAYQMFLPIIKRLLIVEPQRRLTADELVKRLSALLVQILQQNQAAANQNPSRAQ